MRGAVGGTAGVAVGGRGGGRKVKQGKVAGWGRGEEKSGTRVRWWNRKRVKSVRICWRREDKRRQRWRTEGVDEKTGMKRRTTDRETG